MPPSNECSRSGTLQMIRDFAMKVFQVTALTTVALLAWFMWGIISGSLADVPKRSAADQVLVMQTIQNFSSYLNISLLLNLISGAICFYDESAYGVVLLIIAGFLDYGMQYCMDAVIGNTKSLVAGKASHLSLAALHQSALMIAVPGILLVIYNIIAALMNAGNRSLGNATLGKGMAAQQNAPSPIVGAFAPCWQLPFCRTAIKETCPIYHAKTKCWQQGVGCMCEQNIIQLAMSTGKQRVSQEELSESKGFVALGDLINKDEKDMLKSIPTRIGPRGVKIPVNPNITPQQQKERCHNCIIYTEHQRLKYNFFAPLVTLIIPVLAFLQFENLKAFAGQMVEKFDSIIGHVTLNIGKVTDFSQKVAGSFSLEFILVICATLVLLTWSLRFLEYCVFKIKI